jgi:hypothetical protein
MIEESLADASVDREVAHITNDRQGGQVKARGKRRIHDKPNAAEVATCRPSWPPSRPSSSLVCSCRSGQRLPRRSSGGASE